MENLRRRIDEGFAAFARLIYRNRIKTLVLMALLVGGLLSQMPKLTSDNSIDVWFHEDDPDLIAYDAFQDQFGPGYERDHRDHASRGFRYGFPTGTGGLPRGPSEGK